MKHILRCYYLDSERYPDENNMLATCEFLDEHGNENYEPKVYEYLATTMNWDIYIPDDIQKHFEIINNMINQNICTPRINKTFPKSLSCTIIEIGAYITA